MAWNSKKGDIVRNAKMPGAGAEGITFPVESYYSAGSGVGGVASKTGGYTQPDRLGMTPNKPLKVAPRGANRSTTKA